MALIGLPSATMARSSSSGGERPPFAVIGRRSASTIAGSSAFPPRGDRPDRIDQLIPLGDVILQEVPVAGRALGQQGHGVLRIVVLGEDHDTGPRMPLAHLLGRVDALTIEGRGHPDVGDQDLRLQGRGPVDDLVVVRSHAHDPQILVPLNECLDPLADDEIVVGQEHRDRAGTIHCVIHGCSSHIGRASRTGGDHPAPGGARYTMREPVTTLVNAPPPVEAVGHDHRRADPAHRCRHLALLDPD